MPGTTRVKDLGEDFQTFDDARPGTIEILIAVATKMRSLCTALSSRQPGGTQAAASREAFLPCRSRKGAPGRHPGRRQQSGPNARRAKQVLPTGHLHEFRHPVATAISGSIHSIMAARGRVRAVPLCLAMLLMRAEKRFQKRAPRKKTRSLKITPIIGSASSFRLSAQ
jgi:hypothetical protein